ncbi:MULTISPECIES: DNA polymerase III subunit delta [Corynebacterium]|uniref:DNA polymerase III subunit delta n=1 Tax=Corynebacterium haemomassiliense TaxID=2754726 RepID=A0A7W2I3N8_9CORY|nr:MULTISPECIES: DNA polymerase III subunit delta [Corynebacterium]MBA5244264.1 DNA polymerase III subunit delta [Corynebacterium haemomassiliense]MCG7290607.1 DNA polymerase III subunit delta [Corynebacterium sp. ACRPZ]MCG7295120.1 DNA polymerase III subunit delta [Corynebacterium sp. ACRPY]
MARMLNPVHLVLGEDDFLAERATKAIVAQAGEGVEVTTLRAGDVSEGEIAMATSPSLFAEDRVVVVKHAELAGKEPTEILLQACVNPAPGITLIIEHTGGGRQKAMVKKFAKVAEVHKADPLKDNERRSWLMEEFRSHGVRPTPDVAAAVLESVGSDLRELASAVSQLVSDTEGELTVESVRAYYVGVAEVAGFDIADQAVAGRADRALASTRRALQLGTSPVSIAAALARKVGDIAKLHGVRGNPDQLARTVGMHPYVAKKTMQVARQWSGDAVSHAVIIVSDLDAEVKGQGGDPEFALENAVRRIAELA